MKRLLVLVVLVGTVGLGLVFQAMAGSSAKVLKFGRMAPVVAPFTGTTHPIRGIGGDGVPWAITSAEGQLQANGKLEIEVHGLIIPARGNNPISAFRGVVNCLTTGSPDTGVNLVTDPFPATPAGDATIEATLTLPTPCIAPIIFVTNGTGSPPGAWFATTGRG